MEFGALPPAFIKNLRAKQVVIRDAAGAWLKFEATPELVDSLRSGFVPSNRAIFDEHSRGENTPRWWTPDADQMTTFFVKDGWKKEFSHSTAVIAHDAGKRVVYFSHAAMD